MRTPMRSAFGLAVALSLTAFSPDASAQCDPFFHWNVRTSLQADMATVPEGYDFYFKMEDRLDFDGLPIARDILDLPEAAFRVANCDPDIAMYGQGDWNTFPETGPHEMLRDANGNYAAWASNYDAWISALRDQLACICDQLIPPGSPIRIAVIDWEAWDVQWDSGANSTGERHEWEEAVRAINGGDRPGWDLRFLQDIMTYGDGAKEFDVRGTRDYTQLEALHPETAEELLKTSWEYFTRHYYEVTLHEVNVVLRPEVAWGFYYKPYRGTPFVNDVVRERNDSLAWLYPLIDVLCPTWYPTAWYTTGPGNNPKPPKDRSLCVGEECFATRPWAGETFYESNLDELLRIKTTYGNPDMMLLPYVSWLYSDTALIGNEGCCNLEHRAFLNDINLAAQIIKPYNLVSSTYGQGLDGLVIWGNFRAGDEPYRYSVDCDIHTRWADYFRQGGICGTAEGQPQGDCLVIREPIRDEFEAEIWHLLVQGATPGSRVRIVAGNRLGSTPIPQCPAKGLSIQPAVPVSDFSLPVDSAGQAALTIRTRRDLSGLRIYFQAWEEGSCRVSNPAIYEFP